MSGAIRSTFFDNLYDEIYEARRVRIMKAINSSHVLPDNDNHHPDFEEFLAKYRKKLAGFS